MKLNRKASLAVALAFVALLCATLLCVFFDAMFSGHTLFSGDNAPIYPRDLAERRWHAPTGAWTPVVLGVGHGGIPMRPTQALALFLPPLVYRVASYIFDIVLSVLAGLYFFHGRGIRGTAAWSGSLALGFAGYAFSLIAAGHLTTFDMMPFGIFLFGLIDRGIERRSLLHFALLGAAVAFGVMAQPDVMGLFVLWGAAYGLFRLARTWPTVEGNRGLFLGRLVLGGVLAAVFMLAVGAVGYVRLNTEIIPTRHKDRGQTPEQKWEYATNWSMPPEELVEFVAPCIYGVQTGEPTGPYWGRLGRAMNWQPGARALMNLRQHTVYMGVLQIVFAFLAILFAMKRDPEDDEEGPTSSIRGDVCFWSIAGLLALLLALGRYFPLYRAFYMIPGAASIRCPVKFVHLFEVALGFLFGFGLHAFGGATQDDNGREPRKVLFGLGIACGIIGVVFGVSALAVRNPSAGLVGYWRELGLERFQDVLVGNMSGALLHAMVLFLVAGAVLLAGHFWRGRRWVGLLPWAIALVLCADIVAVGRRYVIVRDVSAFYANNPVAEYLLERDSQRKGRTSYYLSPRVWQHGLWTSFAYVHVVDIVDPRSDRAVLPEYREFLAALSRNPVRLWQITNTRYILGPLETLESLIKQPVFDVVMRFDTANQRVQSINVNGANAVVEFSGALPRAIVFHRSREVPESKVTRELLDASWDPAKSVLTTGGPEGLSSARAPSPATIRSYELKDVVVDVDLEEEGILLLNDKYDPNWRVTIDEEEAEIFRANSLMRGVHVPAGKHVVHFSYYPTRREFRISVIAMAVLLIWGLLRLLLHGRRRTE